MKFISAVVVLCTLAVAAKAGITKEKAIETIRSFAGQCMQESGATDADFDVMIRHVPALNRETMCLRACVMKKMGVLSDDGKFLKDAAMKIAEHHEHGDAAMMKIADEVTTLCSGIPISDDHCEAAEAYKMCLAAEAKKHGTSIVD